MAFDFIDWLRNLLPSSSTGFVPTRAEAESRYKTTPTPTPENNIEEAIRLGLQEYSKTYAGGQELPIERHIGQMAEAAEKYPIFKKYPFLLPQMSILESSAGLSKGVQPDGTYKNNPLSWGARIQAAGGYNPKSWEESINDAITAIAGDVEARPPSQPIRHRQTTYYEPFRKSQSIADFAKAYERREDEGASYAHDIIEGMKVFEKYLK